MAMQFQQRPSSDAPRLAVVKDAIFDSESGRCTFSLLVEDKVPINGFARGDLITNSFVKAGDLVVVKVFAVKKIKPGWFRKYPVAICVVISTLKLECSLTAGWIVREHVPIPRK